MESNLNNKNYSTGVDSLDIDTKRNPTASFRISSGLKSLIKKSIQIKMNDEYQPSVSKIKNADFKGKLVVLVESNELRKSTLKDFFSSFEKSVDYPVVCLKDGNELISLVNFRMSKFGFDPRIAVVLFNGDKCPEKGDDYCSIVRALMKDGRIKEFALLGYYYSFTKKVCKLKSACHELIENVLDFDSLEETVSKYIK